MKKRVKNLFYFVFVIVAIYSCDKPNSKNIFSRIFSTGNIEGSSSTVSAKELMDYVIKPDNGLIKKKKISEFIYQVKFKPLDYIISKELKGNVIDSAEYIKKYNELSGLQYFDFRIEVEGISTEILKYNLQSISDYEERINYLAFKMQSDFKLVEGSDTLDCLIYHMERAYDVVPYTTVLLGFNTKVNSYYLDKTIIFTDNLFKNGIIKFTFITADLIQIPKLEII